MSLNVSILQGNFFPLQENGQSADLRLFKSSIITLISSNPLLSCSSGPMVSKSYSNGRYLSHPAPRACRPKTRSTSITGGQVVQKRTLNIPIPDFSVVEAVQARLCIWFIAYEIYITERVPWKEQVLRNQFLDDGESVQSSG
jgi:hypothetical protein